MSRQRLCYPFFHPRNRWTDRGLLSRHHLKIQWSTFHLLATLGLVLKRRKTYSSRVNSNAIILVVNVGAGDGDASRITNIKAVSVRTRNDTRGKQIVPIDVVDRDTGHCEISARVDAKHLDWSVIDVNV